jgi:putative transport protein
MGPANPGPTTGVFGLIDVQDQRVDQILDFLASEPLALLFLLLGVGTLLGSVRVKGVELGPAAVLFSAIAITAFADTRDIELLIPREVGILGLVLFTFCIGILSGPNFFAALRSGLGPIASTGLILVAAAFVAWGVGSLLDLSGGMISGTFAGSLTNTPALAAATERAGNAEPTIGYSIAYLYGVVGMLGATMLALRSRRPESGDAKKLTNLTVRVERADEPRIRDIEMAHAGKVAFSRVRHGEANPIVVAEDDDTLRHDDLVTVVGPRGAVDRVAVELGHASSHRLVEDRSYLDFRRITLSKPAFAGRSVEAIGLADRFGATVSRVRRGDVDMVATADLVLQPGDRLRVIAPAGSMDGITKYLGDSTRGLSDINPLGLAIGMVLGIWIGSIHIPLPGGGFELGAAAGTLILGLAFGRVGRVGPVVVSMPHASATTLSQLGMLVFLAYAGTTAGGLFVKAISSSAGWKIAVLGLITTTFTAAALIVVMRGVHKIEGTRLAGQLGGTQTQPAILAYANEQTGYDNRVALGYALVYPMAMIAKILLAQLLVGF